MSVRKREKERERERKSDIERMARGIYSRGRELSRWKQTKKFDVASKLITIQKLVTTRIGTKINNGHQLRSVGEN